MNEEERIKHIRDQIKKDDICILYASMDKPFSNIKKFKKRGNDDRR